MKSSEIIARRRALVVRMQTEGAEAAYKAALAVCEDTKAPAPARATCATTILRAGGFLNTRSDDHAPKEPHEMTSSELAARLAELRSGGGQVPEDKTGDPDVFD
jgi:hypothetical protein|tara:strand:+ start:7345 stop:7656 length:312 start_codon:yes stop_codon:yes gene_type:complete